MWLAVELKSQFHLHGDEVTHHEQDLLVHIEAGIIRIPRGFLEKLPGEEEPFG